MADPVEGRRLIDAEHEQRCRNSIETGGTLTNSGGRLLLREIDELRSLLMAEQIAHDHTLDQRDRAEAAADSLAYTIAPIELIGEHSSGNDPWENAALLHNRPPTVDEMASLVRRLADSEAAVSAAVEAERARVLALVDAAERSIHLEALDMDEARMTVVGLRRAIEQGAEE